MPVSFDTTPSSEGANVAGKTQGSTFVPASILVYSNDGGVTYEQVNSTTALPIKELRASTPANTQVDASPVSTTLLAANANRLGATFYNNSTTDLYLVLGATASTETFTIKMAAGGYYELPFHYVGAVAGIWPSASAGTGTADGEVQVTELTA